MLDYDLGEGNVHVGPSDYVPWLTDRKWAYIRMEGSSFGDVPLNIELKLEVWDSPNSAGIVIDAVRMAKLALNNGVAGALEGPSSYLMKSPPVQIVDDEAYEATEKFIAQNALKKAKATAARVTPWVGSGAMGTLALEPASRFTLRRAGGDLQRRLRGLLHAVQPRRGGVPLHVEMCDDDLDASRVASWTASRPGSARSRSAATGAGSAGSASPFPTAARASASC